MGLVAATLAADTRTRKTSKKCGKVSGRLKRPTRVQGFVTSYLVIICELNLKNGNLSLITSNRVI